MVGSFIIVLPLLMAIFHVSFATLLELGKLTVDEGDYFHYTLPSNDSYLYILLESLSGDCDLYVSEVEEHPTCDRYSYHSATCGADFVIVPNRQNRMVHIGVYGNPPFEISDCLLLACSLDLSQYPDEYVDQLKFLSSVDESVIGASCKRTAGWMPKWSRKTGGSTATLEWILGTIWNYLVWTMSSLIFVLEYLEDISDGGDTWLFDLIL